MLDLLADHGIRATVERGSADQSTQPHRIVDDVRHRVMIDTATSS